MADKRKPSTQQNKPRPASPSAPKAQANGGLRAFASRAAITATVLALIFGIVLSASSMRGELLQNKIPFAYNGVLQKECLFPIDFEEEQLKDIVRATKRRGQTLAFTYFCNRTLHLENADLPGFILFGNPDDNDCTLVLSIMDADGNMIYCSGGVLPGSYITQICPFDRLAEGSYPCTAYVSAYKGEGLEQRCVGVQYSRLTVEVGETS